MVTIRQITEDECRPVYELLIGALHGPRPDDEAWRQVVESYVPVGRFAAFDGDLPIGVTGSMRTDLCVPGGATVAAAAVDGIGVRAGYTRRGVLTRLMAEQFADSVRRGDVLSVLHASEATIYGRFGYGVATRAATMVVDRSRATLRPDVPPGGVVRTLSPEDSVTLVPHVYGTVGCHRAGMIARPRPWWLRKHVRPVRAGATVAVHRNVSGMDDGFVTYRSVYLGNYEQPFRGVALEIDDLHAADPDALAALWRFLLSIDLVAEIRVRNRPVDELVAQLFTDPRAGRIADVRDELWLRLLDVPAALAARSYGPAEPVIVQVRDRQLAANEGSYRIGVDGVSRVGRSADVIMDVETLGMLYLGEWRSSALAAIGRIEVVDPAALGRLDALLTTDQSPWCGTQF